MAEKDGDHVASDDPELGAILEMSRIEYQSSASKKPSPSSSRPRPTAEPSYRRKHAINAQIADLDTEISGYDEDIKQIKALRSLRVNARNELLEELQRTRAIPATKGKGKERATQDGIDYTLDGFDWSHELEVQMKKVFGIDGFRLCQRGVCNANMDGRDIVCVMPTGGGKSLTYQLPALLTPGCTLVISPLIALITDQIFHLRDAGVEAVMLTGGTSKQESRDIHERLTSLANRKVGLTDKEIKLCYVTPEKIAKSKPFMAMLEKLNSGRKLARIVIDEAHCVSQLGHDFRPDYQKLHVLRQLFPDVPIMALSATCPPKVLQDLVDTLRLKAVVDGKDAKRDGTVYFSAPLYRKNLHYSVIPKPPSSNAALRLMTNFILQCHPKDSGIVYCLRKKDAENVALGLSTISGGKIKTGVYHADVKDHEKESLHKQWRQGNIKVVCATIAFGLGIDKGDVRFVLHHSMSKSLDGFYQESGRAGRDGKDADCVLYYRPQDGTTLSSIMCSEKDGQPKLHDMLRFAQEMRLCRKVHFAQYFSASSQLSVSSWTTDDSDALESCGHCDNCTRAPGNLDHRDMTVEAWKILKITEALQRSGGRLTLSQLGELVRGAGGGAYEMTTGGGGRKGKEKAKEKLDLKAIAGGSVNLTKDETEYLLVHLLILKYLGETYHSTSHRIIVYVTSGPEAIRLTRLSRDSLGNARTPRIECSFRKPGRKSKSSSGKTTSSKTPAEKSDACEKRTLVERGRATKRKRETSSSEDEDGDDEDNASLVDFIVLDDEEVVFGDEKRASPSRHQNADTEEDGDTDEEDGWKYTMRPAPPPQKKHRKSSMSAKGKGKFTTSERNIVREGDNDVWILSSD